MNFPIKKVAMTMLLGMSLLTAFAQQKVTGTVKDSSGEPMMGVTVVADGKPLAVTDMDGNFTLPAAKPGMVLKISYVGYKEQTLKPGNSTTLSIVMQEDNKTLDELVVVGYGQMKKSDLTGSISSVNDSKLTGRGTTSVSEALQGSVAGVIISPSTSGGSRAGGGISMQIRGQTSINNQAQPLYVIDGVVSSTMDFLNPNDIERIDILKDASSTAIYGSRASAGVVIITTKGSRTATKTTRTTVSYDGFYGVKTLARMPEFMGPTQWMDYRVATYNRLDDTMKTGVNGVLIQGVDAAGHPHYVMPTADWGNIFITEKNNAKWADDWKARHPGQPLPAAPDWNNSRIYDQYMAARRGEFAGYNWKDLVTQTAGQQNHFLSIAGAAADMNYRIGMGYQDEDNVLKENNYKRYNFKSSLDAKLGKVFEAGFSANFAYSKLNDFCNDSGYSPYTNAFYFNPYINPYAEDGTLRLTPATKDAFNSANAQFTSTINPLVDLFDRSYADQTREYRLLANLYVRAHILPGLQFTTTFSPNFLYRRHGVFFGTGINEHNPVGSAFYQDKSNGKMNKAVFETKQGFEWTWDNQVDYNVTLGAEKEHSLSAMGLFSMWKTFAETAEQTSKGIAQDQFTWNNMGAGSGDKLVDTGYTEARMVSVAGRLNYAYMGKYMATATLRADGSSRFAKGHQWGWFPSFALAWRASEEGRLKERAKWLDNLKFRLSYGISGNNNVGDYVTMNTAGGPHYFEMENAMMQGYYTNALVNTELMWEKIKEFDFGIDLSALRNRINLTVDLYNRLSDGQIMTQTVPFETGASGSKPYVNIGSVRNKGIEIGLNGDVVRSRDFNWNVAVNWARNWNKVVETSTGNDELTGSPTGNLFIGQPLNVLYDYTRAGVVTDQGVTMHTNKGDKHYTLKEIYERYGKNYNIYEGQAIWNDLNDDGIFDNNDKMVYGTLDPRWTASLTSTWTYKGFDLSVMLYTKSGLWSRSYFHSKFLNYSDRGRTQLPFDYYIPLGAWYVNEQGEQARWGYDAAGNLIPGATPHYADMPYPANPGANSGATYSSKGTAGNSMDYLYKRTSFTKVKNITLGYTFDKQLISKLGLSYLRLYVNVTNPFVFTSYKGFDPEWAGANLQNGGPASITYQFGVNLKF